MAEAEMPREDLLKSMKRTKGVRFNASKRLEKRERTTTSTIAYASVSVIVLTILPGFFELHPFLLGLLSLGTVGMSVVILTATLIQNSDSGLVKSDQFHRCALEVNALRRSLLAADPNGDVAPFAEKYNDIMQRYGLNHDPADYQQYRDEHPDEFLAEAQADSKLTSEDDGVASKKNGAIDVPHWIALATGGAILAAVSADAFSVVPAVFKGVADGWAALTK